MTVLDRLDELSIVHGVHLTANRSVRLDGPDWTDRVSAITGRLGDDPPTSIAGIAVLRRDRPAADVLRMWLSDDTRVVVRPSGTEPKIKYYCEAVEEPTEHLDRARRRAAERLDAVVAGLESLLEV